MSTGETIFYAIVGFFALLAILVFLRLLLRKGPPHWSQLKIGFFIERTPSFDDDEEFVSVPMSERKTEVLPVKERDG